MKKFGFNLALCAAITLSLVTDTLASAATRIRFKQGATSATVNGSLASGASRRFVVKLEYRQIFVIKLSSGNNDIGIKVSDLYGSYKEEFGYFETETNANGDHYITIHNHGRRTTRYAMTVWAY